MKTKQQLLCRDKLALAASRRHACTGDDKSETKHNGVAVCFAGGVESSLCGIVSSNLPVGAGFTDGQRLDN